jgi:hypothetical protein
MRRTTSEGVSTRRAAGLDTRVEIGAGVSPGRSSEKPQSIHDLVTPSPLTTIRSMTPHRGQTAPAIKRLGWEFSFSVMANVSDINV